MMKNIVAVALCAANVVSAFGPGSQYDPHAQTVVDRAVATPDLSFTRQHRGAIFLASSTHTTAKAVASDSG